MQAWCVVDTRRLIEVDPAEHLIFYKKRHRQTDSFRVGCDRVASGQQQKSIPIVRTGDFQMPGPAPSA
jgi:hypothetical protein